SKNAILPVGKTIKSIFPLYVDQNRLGGPKRPDSLTADELTNRDLEAAVLDVRTNALRVYSGVFEEYSYLGDTNKNLQTEWSANAREAIRDQQEIVIEHLEKNVKQASEFASEEIMYQNKEEALRELEFNKKIL